MKLSWKNICWKWRFEQISEFAIIPSLFVSVGVFFNRWGQGRCLISKAGYDINYHVIVREVSTTIMQFLIKA